MCQDETLFETKETLTRRTVLMQMAAAAAVASPVVKAAAETMLPRGGGAESPVATTNLGKVRGTRNDGIYVFKGIPYGDDTAKRRFMKAVPAKPWTGVRDALAYGLSCPQPVLAPSKILPHPPEPSGEDCLTVNVWTPGLHDHAKRPVLVWLHGGGYNALSANSPYYDGTRLCKRGDVVVVGINHRLNAFGFLYLAELGGPEFKDSGNVGMSDLVLALEWIRDNIAEFGGDPNRLTLFGESGGGAKSATLMAMPSAHGLFHHASSSSGETVTASRPETATKRARAVLAALGLSPDNIQPIKTVPTEKLVAASKAAGYYGPVVDGGILPRHPFDPDAPSISRMIPFMVGTNHDESRLLVGRNNPAYFHLTWDNLHETLAKYADGMGTLNLDDVIAMYRKSDPSYTASDVFFRATTDSRDWRPALEEIERRAAQGPGAAPTYSYQLDFWSPTHPELRACHALDVPFLFDNLALNNALSGTGPEAQLLADQMSETYIAFARTGNPNNSKIPHWPAYDLTRRSTMVLNVTSKVVDDPRPGPRKLFGTVHYENPGT